MCCSVMRFDFVFLATFFEITESDVRDNEDQDSKLILNGPSAVYSVYGASEVFSYH